MAKMGEMHADLMRPACLWLGINKGEMMESAYHAVKSDRFARGDSVHFHPRAFGRITADTCIDFPVIRLKATVNERAIVLVDGPCPELVRKGVVRRVIFGNDDQPGGHFVETMNNPRPQLSSNRGKPAKVIKQRIDKRAGFCAYSNVDGHPGRLVHHSEVFILIDDGQRQFFSEGPDRLALCEDADAVAGFKFLTCF